MGKRNFFCRMEVVFFFIWGVQAGMLQKEGIIFPRMLGFCQRKKNELLVIKFMSYWYFVPFLLIPQKVYGWCPKIDCLHNFSPWKKKIAPLIMCWYYNRNQNFINMKLKSHSSFFFLPYDIVISFHSQSYISNALQKVMMLSQNWLSLQLSPLEEGEGGLL